MTSPLKWKTSSLQGMDSNPGHPQVQQTNRMLCVNVAFLSARSTSEARLVFPNCSLGLVRAVIRY